VAGAAKVLRHHYSTETWREDQATIVGIAFNSLNPWSREQGASVFRGSRRVSTSHPCQYRGDA
jgi:hypothetical protein